MSSKQEQLEQLATEIRACEKCVLHQGRTHAVPGEGNPDSPIMLIGEGPGFNEDQQGRPFVGAAGQFLEELLASVSLKREDVFIANVVKCRPPQNRDPEPVEIETCVPYLRRQFAIIAPKIIATLGRYSMGLFFKDAKISQIHGRPKKVGDIIVIPMYHPAAALHQPDLKVQIMIDFQVILKVLETIEQDSLENIKKEQMNLFN